MADVAEAIFDGPHATPKLTADGPVFLGISSLAGGRLDLTQSGHVSDEDFKKWTRRVQPQAEDLVFSYETRLGEAALIPPGLVCCLGRRMALVRPNRAVVDPRFLLYAYLGPQFQEVIRQRTVHGSTVSRIPLVEFSDFEIDVPPLSEQRAIAEVLGALDDKIESNRRIVEISESLLAALATTLNDLPKVPLSEVATATRNTEDPTQYGDGPVDHFSIPAFDAGGSPERVAASEIKSGKLRVTMPSVLVSRLNPGTQRVWVVEPRDVPALCSTEFLVLQPFEASSLGAVWLAAISREFSESMERRATGTSFSHQRIKHGDTLSIEVPDVRQLSAQVSGLADALLQAVLQQRLEVQMLGQVRDTLLPTLLSGRIRAPVTAELVEAS